MGRPATAEPKPYHVEHIQEIHHEVLRLLILGRRPKEIAAITGLTESFISKLRNSPVCRERLEVLGVAKDAETVATSRIIARVQPRAAKLLEDVIEGKIDASVGRKIKTAQDMLSRGGHAPVQHIRDEHTYGITKETLDALKQRAEDARALAEADYEVVEENSNEQQS